LLIVPATQAASRRMTNSKPSLEISVTYCGDEEVCILVEICEKGCWGAEQNAENFASARDFILAEIN